MKEEPIITQEVIKFQKDDESKPILQVELPTISLCNSYSLHCLNLETEVTITEALLLFSMSKWRNETIYDVFPMDVWYLFFRRPLNFGPKIVFHARPNFQVQTFTLNLLNSHQPQTPQKLKLYKEIIYTSKPNVKLSPLLA